MTKNPDVLCLENKNHTIQNIALSSIFLGGTYLFFIQSLPNVSWLGCIFSMVLYCLFLGIIAYSFPKKYYFDSKEITIADHKNEFLAQIPVSDVLSWNHYSVRRDRRGRSVDTVRINTSDGDITFKKDDFKNYDEMIAYFENSEIVRDESLDDSVSTKDLDIFSKLDSVFVSMAIIGLVILPILFWSITRKKVETNEILYFEGRIEKIEYLPKHHDIILTLAGVSDCNFSITETADVDFFKGYVIINYKETYTQLGKKIRIGISKSEYDWQIKDTFIRKFSNKKMDIINYTIIE